MVSVWGGEVVVMKGGVWLPVYYHLDFSKGKKEGTMNDKNGTVIRKTRFIMTTHHRPVYVDLTGTTE
jgi:hypothetical protein